MQNIDPSAGGESTPTRILKALQRLLFGAGPRALPAGPRPVPVSSLPVRHAFAGPAAFAPRRGAVGEPRPHLMNARTPLVIGVLVILATFVGFGGWAALAPIDSAAIAPGTVAVESGRQTIQHLEGGIIKKILVQEGDHVKAGQVLIRLDGAQANANLDLVQGELDLADAAEARLDAERDGLRAVVYPSGLLARRSDPRVAQLISDQNHLFKSQMSVLTGQEAVLHQQIAEYQQQIAGYRAIIKAKEEQLTLVRSELSDLTALLAQGYVTKTRVVELQEQQGQLEGDRGQAIADTARAQQGIGEVQRQILELQNQQQEDVGKDLHDLDQQISDLQQKHAAASDVVNRLDIVSPMDGVVSDLSVHTVGGVINPGQQLMEIVPGNDQLVIEAEINPMDIDTVHVGQDVSLRVMATGSRLLPSIDGRLEEVSADRITTPAEADVPAKSYYEARISVSPEQAARLAPVELRVGMPVEAMVERGSQTALHYALKPLIDSLTRSFREQ